MGRLADVRPGPSISRVAYRELGADIESADLFTVAAAAKMLPDERKRAVLRKLKSRIHPDTLKVPGERTVAAKLLVALLPVSAAALKGYLQRQDTRWWYELHFSLFCFLDHAYTTRFGPEVNSMVLGLVGDYLLSVPVDTARAAWMAGDLLGEHWPATDSLPLLRRAAVEAQYAVGRSAAIHGLQHALRQIQPGSQDARDVLDLLRQIAKSDRSSDVRHAADWAIRNQRRSSSSV